MANFPSGEIPFVIVTYSSGHIRSCQLLTSILANAMTKNELLRTFTESTRETYETEMQAARQGVVASTLNLFRNGAVGSSID